MKKKVLSIILAICSLLCFCAPVAAIDGDNSGTGAEGGYADVSGSTWDVPQQGYRFCIVDSSGNPVSNAVDILYSARPSNSELYVSSRTGGTVSQILLWSQLGVTPPKAVVWNGGPVGNGEAFKIWFLSNYKKVLDNKQSGNYIFKINGKTGAPSKIMEENNYSVTVEPITWFVPAAWTNGAIGKNYGKYIYGTIYNICGWYKNTSGSSAYGSAGGAYSNVLSVMWQSMYTLNGIGSVSGATEASVTSAAAQLSSLSSVYDKLKNGFGAALHVYYLGGTVASPDTNTPETGDPIIGTGSRTYPKKTRVITSVTLHNTTDKDFTTLNPVTVTFKVNGSTYKVENVVIPAGGEQLVWISWTTPNATGWTNMTVTTTAGRFESDGGYADSLKLGIYIINSMTENPPPDPQVDDTAKDFSYTESKSNSSLRTLLDSNKGATHSWSVWGCTISYKDNHKNVSPSELTAAKANIEADFGVIKNVSTNYTNKNYYTIVAADKVEEKCSQLETSGATITSIDVQEDGKVKIRYKRREISSYTIYYKEMVASYYQTKYTASLKTSAVSVEITPSDNCPTWYKSGGDIYMKSGYGFNISVGATMTYTVTGSTGNKTTTTLAPGKYNSGAIAPQYAKAFFPEFTYQTYNRLLTKNNGTFEFKTNEYSSLGDNAHFTPIWYPDNTDYKVLVTCYCAYTPVGVITVSAQSNEICIEGNIYDDWHVAPVQ